jgi:hypothetical protein
MRKRVRIRGDLACVARQVEIQLTVMFARGSSTRAQMKSPSIAQRGEGGARGGSGESALLSKAACRRSVMPD